MKRAVAILALALSSACAAKTPKSLNVTVKCGPDGNLESATFGSKTIIMRGGDPFDRIKAALGKDRPAIHLVADTDVPYRCIGGLIYTMQRLGFAKVGFVAEPPPTDDAAR